MSQECAGQPGRPESRGRRQGPSSGQTSLHPLLSPLVLLIADRSLLPSP